MTKWKVFKFHGYWYAKNDETGELEYFSSWNSAYVFAIEMACRPRW